MSSNYRFHIQPLVGSVEPCFRLTVGMAEERDHELIPVNRSAFAHRLVFQEFHPTEEGAAHELTCLLEWLESRSRP